MLKDIFKSDDNEEKNVKSEEKVSKETKIIGIVFLVVMVFLVISNSFSGGISLVDKDDDDKNNNNVTNNEKNDEADRDILDKITDNYDMEVIKKVGGISYTFNYSRDKNVISSEANLDKLISYVEYKGKLYQIGEDNELALVLRNELDDYFNDKYYDIDLIHEVFRRSKSNGDNKYIYKLSDYFKEYNYKYDTSYKPEDKELTMEAEITDSYVKFVIDYTLVDKVINNEENSLIYEILIHNIDGNNYDDIGKVIDEKYN